MTPGSPSEDPWISLDGPRMTSGWHLARNCHRLNNAVPTVMFAMLSNMDFQATLTNDAVIWYMTKYMTKSGQGALIKVMEHSFSLCIENARERQQGTGSAVLRWFNLPSISEVKSQLGCMHLIFGALDTCAAASSGTCTSKPKRGRPRRKTNPLGKCPGCAGG